MVSRTDLSDENELLRGNQIDSKRDLTRYQTPKRKERGKCSRFGWSTRLSRKKDEDK